MTDTERGRIALLHEVEKYELRLYNHPVLVLKIVRDAEALNSCVKTTLKLRIFRIFYIMSHGCITVSSGFKLLDMLTILHNLL